MKRETNEEHNRKSPNPPVLRSEFYPDHLFRAVLDLHTNL
jgi:hypothetical protein